MEGRSKGFWRSACKVRAFWFGAAVLIHATMQLLLLMRSLRERPRLPAPCSLGTGDLDTEVR